MATGLLSDPYPGTNQNDVARIDRPGALEIRFTLAYTETGCGQPGADAVRAALFCLEAA